MMELRRESQFANTTLLLPQIIFITMKTMKKIKYSKSQSLYTCFVH